MKSKKAEGEKEVDEEIPVHMQKILGIYQPVEAFRECYISQEIADFLEHGGLWPLQKNSFWQRICKTYRYFKYKSKWD